MSTIFAPATAPGRAGVAVVRISGPLAKASAESLAGPLPEDGRRLCRLVSKEGDHLDTALVLVFPEGRSFTGEETVELHLHGAPVIVRRLNRELSDMEGVRFAEPGEFTRRAFENGMLDLSQVEGLSDLLDAETERQRQQALRVLSGALGEKAEGWRDLLIRATALVEATIDFADEEVPVDVRPEVRDVLDELLKSVRSELRGFGASERLRDGFEVAIVGAPNLGKSTLLNYLAGREAALTSEVAGTTRDVIEVGMEIAGLAVTFLDTAGMRETDDPVERMGVERAEMRAKQADLRIYLRDIEEELPIRQHPDDILLVAKADKSDCGDAGVSGLTGKGVAELVGRIGEILGERVSGGSDISKERHRAALELAMGEVERGLSLLDELESHPDLVSEHLRAAIRAVESLVGRVDVEHVLGEIFASFCIGK